MTYPRIVVVIPVISFIFMSVCNAKANNHSITGIYKNGPITYEFKNGKCYGYIEGKLKSESHVKEKDNLIFISPNIPDMRKMIRDVWVVWELKENKLISRYLVDMNDGTKFYEERSGELVFIKVDE